MSFLASKGCLVPPGPGLHRASSAPAAGGTNDRRKKTRGNQAWCRGPCGGTQSFSGVLAAGPTDGH